MKEVVSVVVPCYNQAEFLDEALQSVLDQTYQNWECIIVNDGSPDNTREIALKWVEKDGRFKYVEKENEGLSAARNTGIDNASGAYILPLDNDDKISPKYIEEAVKVFEDDPEVKLVYCKARLFGEKNKKWKLADYSYRDMVLKNMIFCSCLYRKKDFEKTGGYATYMSTAWEDWEFLIRFLDPDSKVVRLDGYHFFYRIKKSSMSDAADKRVNGDLYLELFKRHQDIYLQYINPIKNYREYIYKKEKKKKKRSLFLNKICSIIPCMKKRN